MFLFFFFFVGVLGSWQAANWCISTTRRSGVWTLAHTPDLVIWYGFAGPIYLHCGLNLARGPEFDTYVVEHCKNFCKERFFFFWSLGKIGPFLFLMSGSLLQRVLEADAAEDAFNDDDDYEVDTPKRRHRGKGRVSGNYITPRLS